jgi:hypothetical protein
VHLSAQQWGPFIGGRGSTGGWLGAARTPCASAIRGAGAALAWATGCGMLQELTGVFVGSGMVWRRGEQARAASTVVCPLLHDRGQRGQRDRGGGEMQRWAGWAGWFPPRRAGPTDPLSMLTLKIPERWYLMECPQEFKILIFEILKLSCSLYWVRSLKLFFLGPDIVFCLRANLNLGFVLCIEFKLWTSYEWC